MTDTSLIASHRSNRDAVGAVRAPSTPIASHPSNAATMIALRAGSTLIGSYRLTCETIGVLRAGLTLMASKARTMRGASTDVTPIASKARPIYPTVSGWSTMLPTWCKLPRMQPTPDDNAPIAPDSL